MKDKCYSSCTDVKTDPNYRVASVLKRLPCCKLSYQKKEKDPADDSGKDTTEASDDSGKDTTEEEDVGEEVSSEEREDHQGILYNKTNLKPYKGGFFKRKILYIHDLKITKPFTCVLL